MNDYENIIRNTYKQLLKQYEQMECVEAGLNGPYDDEETIVRNLCHFIVSTSIEIITYKNLHLLDTLNKLADQLVKEEKPSGLYELRKKDSKDKCNGVIGHAWVIEAFIYLYKVTKKNEYLSKAIKIYSNHKFNSNLGLWNRPIEGLKYSIDFTLNHQLWFAAISGELYSLSKNQFIKDDLDVFFNKLNDNLKTDLNGLVCHNIIKKNDISDTLKSYIKRRVDIIKRIFNLPSYFYKENGYHIFNIAALARLNKIFPDKPFWRCGKFLKLIQYSNNEKLFDELNKANIELDISLKNNITNTIEKKINIYGFPYNVPGFELYYAKQIFHNLIRKDNVEKYILRQIESTYDSEAGIFGKACFDKITINYRIYEYYKALEERDYIDQSK